MGNPGLVRILQQGRTRKWLTEASAALSVLGDLVGLSNPDAKDCAA
jgi:hypothetical protein